MIAVALLSFISATADDFEVDGIHYNVLSASDQTCQVARNHYGYYSYSGDIVIPSSVEFNNRMFSVTGLGDYAFYNCRSLTSIIIPNSITEIGYYAFGDCRSLTSIEIPNSVTKIGQYAFEYCMSLTSIEIPNSVTEIGHRAFVDCRSLTSIVIPNSVTKIEDLAFGWCRSLTSIEIPNSVTEIGADAFQSCTSLTSIEIPNSITKIEDCTFYNCCRVPSIDIPESVDSIGYRVFGYWSSLESLTIPATVTRGDYSMLQLKGCDKLKYLNYLSPCISIKDIPENDKGDSYLPPTIEYIYWNSPSFPCRMMEGKTSCSFTAGELCTYLGRTFDKLTIEEGSTLTINTDDSNIYRLDYLSLDRNNTDCTYTDHNVDHKERVKFVPKQLVLGEHITDCTENIKTDSIVYLQSNAMVPPKIPVFSQKQYICIMPVVPTAALDAYREAPVWKEFWNITDVEGVAADAPKTVVGTYDLNGRAVADVYSGIAIVRYSDGSTKKIVAKP